MLVYLPKKTRLHHAHTLMAQHSLWRRLRIRLKIHFFTMKSAMRYSRKSERWKSKSTKSGNCELEKSVILTTIRITSTVTLMFTSTFVTEAQPLNR